MRDEILFVPGSRDGRRRRGEAEIALLLEEDREEASDVDARFGAVYEHVYESYWGDGKSLYDGEGAG